MRTALLSSSFQYQRTVVQLQFWVSCTFASHSEWRLMQITQVFWIQRHMQQVSFCFVTKTTQKLWLQVSCCLLIRTTQQLSQWLTQVSCSLLIRTTQQLRQQLTHRIFCFMLKWFGNYDDKSFHLEASADCWKSLSASQQRQLRTFDFKSLALLR